jgi:hypothetical protein
MVYVCMCMCVCISLCDVHVRVLLSALTDLSLAHWLALLQETMQPRPVPWVQCPLSLKL